MTVFLLMYSITRIVSLVKTIRYSEPALAVVYEDLFMNGEDDTENKQETTVVINKGEKVLTDSIELSAVSYRYPDQAEYAIEDVSLTIPIGQSDAFVGESGAGKTTMGDIALGLLRPPR